MRAPIIALCVLAAATLARAEVPTAEFDGQSFHLDYQDQAKLPDGQPGNGIAEFTLEGQTTSDWTKLFAFHHYPEAGDDPAAAVETLGKVVKEENPDANFAIAADKGDGTAIIDFLTWAPDSDVMEFNVFKYARAEFGPGLVALQYAHRFKLGDMSVDEFRALRARAVRAMEATDIAPARDYFAGKAKERVGAAPDADETPAASAGADR